MSDFLYDQEVSANSLNNIAIDLGKANFSIFTDGAPYAVDKLNEITAAITSAGVLKTGNMCQVGYVGNKLYIKDGVIVFNSGAKKRILSPIEISASPGSVIYAKHDEQTHLISIEIANNYPTEGDIVHLCKINSDGSLTDNRAVSAAKVALSAENGNMYHDFTIVHEGWEEQGVENEKNTTYYPMPLGGFKYLMLRNITSSELRLNRNSYVFDLDTGGESITVASLTYLIISKTGNILKIVTQRSRVSDTITMSFILA